MTVDQRQWDRQLQKRAKTSSYNRRQWIYFNGGLTKTMCLASYIAQIVCWRDMLFRETLFTLIPFVPLTMFGGLLVLARPINLLLSKTPLGGKVAAADDPGRSKIGAATGLVLSLVLLPPLVLLYFSLQPWPFWWPLVGLTLFIMSALIMNWRLRRLGRFDWKRAQAPIAPEEALKPLPVPSIFDWNWIDRAALQLARPETWRDKWPDDPVIIDLRDRYSRIYRLACGWTTDAFLPDDELEALRVAVKPATKSRSGFSYQWEYVWLQGELEWRFNFKMAKDLLKDLKRPGLTYLDFLARVARELPPDYAAKADEVYSLPLALPPGHLRTKPRATYKIDRAMFENLRWHQLLRPSRWPERWLEDIELAEIHGLVSRVLVEQFYWFDNAFLPDDQLAAILFDPRSLTSRGRVGGPLKKFNRELGLSLTVEEVHEGRLTFLDLLRRLSEIRPPG